MSLGGERYYFDEDADVESLRAMFHSRTRCKNRRVSVYLFIPDWSSRPVMDSSYRSCYCQAASLASFSNNNAI